jgi:hypothetical protein
MLRAINRPDLLDAWKVTRLHLPLNEVVIQALNLK